ncbi:MAG: MATE family efflux transporter [Phycisphaerae bacterium]
MKAAPSTTQPAPRSELRHVITMAVPVVITTSSRALMDVADYVMITKLGLSEAQAAILPAQMIMWTYIVFGLGVVSLVNTFASQALGRGGKHDCSAFAWQGIYVAVFVGLVGAALYPLLPWLISCMGHEPGVQAQELAYGRIALLTVGPTVAAASLAWFFIGVHRPWITTWSVIEANIVNVVVSYVLIFGCFGLEPMGIAGAAWGTFAGVAYRMIRLAVTLLLPEFNRQFGSHATWRFSMAKQKELLRRGIPSGLHWVSEVSVWTIFITIVIGRQFGTGQLIASSIAWQFMRMSFLPTIGVAQALTAMVGKSIGDGTPERAMLQTRLATRLTLGYMGLLSTIYLLFGRHLIAMFNQDPEIVRVGGSIMICAAVFQVFDALGITRDGALRGAGDTFVPAVYFVISTWVVLIGVALWISRAFPSLGALGPWMAATGLIMMTAVFLTLRWNSRAWMKIDLLGKTRGAKDDGRRLGDDGLLKTS